jgi:hypothetical protein
MSVACTLHLYIEVSFIPAQTAWGTVSVNVFLVVVPSLERFRKFSNMFHVHVQVISSALQNASFGNSIVGTRYKVLKVSLAYIFKHSTSFNIEMCFLKGTFSNLQTIINTSPFIQLTHLCETVIIMTAIHDLNTCILDSRSL